MTDLRGNRPIVANFSDAYDSRVSGRIAMQSFNSPSASASLPADLLFSLLLSKVLLALSLYIARNWILAQGFSIWYFTSLVLLIGGIGLGLWEKVWDKSRNNNGKRKDDSTNSLYPILFALEVLFSILALSKLTVLRHVMLTSFCTLWSRGLPLPFLSSAGGNKVYGKASAIFITVGMVVAAYYADILISKKASLIGYTYLLLHLIICGQRTEMLSNRTGDSNNRARIHAIGVMTSACLGALAALIRWTFDVESFYYAPPLKPIAEFGLPSPTSHLLYSSSALLALSFILVDPLLSKALLIHFPVTRQIRSGWPIAVGSSLLVGFVGFGESLSLAEGVIAGLAWTAISQLISSDPRFITSQSSSSSSSSTPEEIKRPLLVSLSIFSSHLRKTIKTILATPESRRIYFFLCLNLAYMIIQMVYGVLTNSLGLISDSIHMFFDCLALGMGLFASVMATWEPNSKFTYGYSRVETLSGFANGLFLCLISIFIVFEAIQRLVDPPEMNTSQLLVVSSVGLAVNLVGMLATGGHHHHGHSHGGHDHGPPKKVAASLPTQDFTYSAQDDHHNHKHDHSSHNHDHSSHDHNHDHSSHDHDHDDEHDHDHSGHSHGHSHNMKGVFLHVLADTLGSVGVIISTLLINRYGWTGFDPLASIFIAVLIFASVVPLVADAGSLLVLDVGEGREEEVRKALLLLNGIEGVASYSMARFWPRDPSTMIGSISIQLAPLSNQSQHQSQSQSRHQHHSHESISSIPPKELADIEQVTARVKKVLRAGIGGLSELTVQVTS